MVSALILTLLLVMLFAGLGVTVSPLFFILIVAVLLLSGGGYYWGPGRRW
jgi:hypothetical protein